MTNSNKNKKLSTSTLGFVELLKPKKTQNTVSKNRRGSVFKQVQTL
jgi:hypothetical protein